MRTDKAQLLEEAQRDPVVLAQAAAALWDDRDVVHAALCLAPALAYEHGPTALRGQVALARLVARRDADAVYTWCEPHVLDDREVGLAALPHPDAAELLLQRHGDDRAVVEAVLRADGAWLAWLDEAARADLAFATAAVERDVTNLAYVAPALKEASRELAYGAVRRDGFALDLLPPHWTADVALVRLAAKTFSGALRFAPDALRHERAFVLDALRGALGFHRPWQYVPAALRADREVLHVALAHGTARLGDVDAWVADDDALVRAALCADPYALDAASERLRGDVRLVMHAVLRGRLDLSSLPDGAAAWAKDARVALAARLAGAPCAVDAAALVVGLDALPMDEAEWWGARLATHAATDASMATLAEAVARHLYHPAGRLVVAAHAQNAVEVFGGAT